MRKLPQSFPVGLYPWYRGHHTDSATAVLKFRETDADHLKELLLRIPYRYFKHANLEHLILWASPLDLNQLAENYRRSVSNRKNNYFAETIVLDRSTLEFDVGYELTPQAQEDYRKVMDILLADQELHWVYWRIFDGRGEHSDEGHDQHSLIRLLSRALCQFCNAVQSSKSIWAGNLDFFPRICAACATHRLTELSVLRPAKSTQCDFCGRQFKNGIEAMPELISEEFSICKACLLEISID
jgi:hypothetical protein